MASTSQAIPAQPAPVKIGGFSRRELRQIIAEQID